MSMYILIQNNSSYSETTLSLWFCSKDEATNFDADIEKTNNFETLKYKPKLLRNRVAHGANGILKNATTAVPLKFFSNFWRSLEMPLINCKVELNLKWTKYCILSVAGNDNVNDNDNENIIFTINVIKLYVPVVTLSARDNKKLLKRLSKSFERSVYLNE